VLSDSAQYSYVAMWITLRRARTGIGPGQGRAFNPHWLATRVLPGKNRLYDRQRHAFDRNRCPAWDTVHGEIRWIGFIFNDLRQSSVAFKLLILLRSGCGFPGTTIQVHTPRGQPRNRVRASRSRLLLADHVRYWLLTIHGWIEDISKAFLPEKSARSYLLIAGEKQ
jgi:hypothetical protein